MHCGDSPLRSGSLLSRALAPAEPLRPLPGVGLPGNDHRYSLTVRWSDLDSYGHVNNVKYYDYIQEARISLMTDTMGWEPEAVWMVVRQDLEYLKPIDFRIEPYEVGTAVAAIGNRSFTLAAEIRDPTSSTVYATARTVVVGVSSLSADQRLALQSGLFDNQQSWSQLQPWHRAWVFVEGVHHRVRGALHVGPQLMLLLWRELD